MLVSHYYLEDCYTYDEVAYDVVVCILDLLEIFRDGMSAFRTCQMKTTRTHDGYCLLRMSTGLDPLAIDVEDWVGRWPLELRDEQWDFVDRIRDPVSGAWLQGVDIWQIMKRE